MDLPPTSSATIWSGVAATKFRAPRQRRELVPRAALVERAARFALDRRVTLVCAPAGFGKSTLLLQLTEALAGCAQSAWLSLDEDDNDINRLFVSLLGALRGVELEWEVDPQTIASQVQEAGPRARAALGATINALSSYQGERLLLVLDDLHRVADAGALQLLADLVERLPPEVGVVIGARLEPALPLARWRARGETGEVLMRDLQFSAADLDALAAARQSSGMSAQMSAADLEQALERTQGWAAGLQLVLGAADRSAVGAMQPVVDRAAGRHLFDFFAQEVLAGLPADLHDFLLQCAVLPELDPALCNAVTGRDDARRVLEDLYRRSLFLTALDETVPVLRFHDLFREFLLTRLVQWNPGLERELHARAARAESIPLRAVAHWLRAGEWAEAIASMQRCVAPLLAEGGQSTVQRWIAQLPAEIVRNDPDVADLQALCAWAQWDFERVAEHIRQAVEGYRRQQREPERLRSFARLPRAFNAVGRLAEASAALAEADALPLELPQRVICDSARAWQCIAIGDLASIGPAFARIAAHADTDPELLRPAIDDHFNSFGFGLPGTDAPMRELRRICRREVERGGASWQIEAFAWTCWPEFLRGDRVEAEAAIQKQAEVAGRLSMVPALRLNNGQGLAWLAAAKGDPRAAVACELTTLQAMANLGLDSLSATWRRATTHNLAHFHWMAADLEGLRALAPILSPPLSAVEWPFVGTGRLAFLGRLALLEGRLDEAEKHLVEAVLHQERWPMPTFFGDLRLSLALLRVRQGRRDDAWACVEPVLRHAVETDSLGPLLMESTAGIDTLLGLMPPALRGEDLVQALLARLFAWRATAPAAIDREPLPEALDLLSEREREVLERIAAGDSNKLIARALDLSPHTVKRHVANILTKLDCTTRGQAAALWRNAR